jgi:hypothetical protein
MDWTAILIGAATGGAVLFVWAAVAWMGLHHHHGDYVPCPGREKIDPVLAALPPRDAFYCIPHFADYPGGMKDPALAARLQQSPSAMLMVWPPGPPMSGATFGRSFLLNVLEAFGLAFLVACVAGQVTGLWSRVAICVGAALFVVVASSLPLANWHASPWRFAFTSAFDKVVGYALVGVALHFVGA